MNFISNSNDNGDGSNDDNAYDGNVDRNDARYDDYDHDVNGVNCSTHA